MANPATPPTAQETSSAITIRRAIEADSQDLWLWRNDPLTRANSIATEPVAKPDHERWYQQALQDPNRFLFIGTDMQDGKIGLCRFDLADGDAQVSINLNPAFRGKGLSAPLLSSAMKVFNRSSQVTLHSTIRHGNAASLRCFEKAGFARDRADSDYQYMKLTSHLAADSDKLKLIDEIEKIRSNNNINWMNLLRLSFRVAPDEAKLLFRKINSDDLRISELFRKLAE